MPIQPRLLEILVCPDTKKALEIAGAELLDRVNRAIRAGRVRTRNGDPAGKEVAEALVTVDGRLLYRVDGSIPVMLIDESIDLRELRDAGVSPAQP